MSALTRRRFLRAAARGLGGTALAGGWGACAAPALEGRADLVFINNAEPETLDPALMSLQLDQRVCYALFEGLGSFSAAGEVQPGVAAGWDVSADGRRYRFTLRRDARWSHGRPVTAQDFVGSWRRALLPQTAAINASLFYFIRGARAFNEGQDPDFGTVAVRAPDDFRLEVELENPAPFFPELCSSSVYCPVPLELVARWGDAWTQPAHVATNGAFTLSAWRLNDRIRLTRNPGYWNAAQVRLGTIDVLPISQANTALNFIWSGAADLLMDKALTPLGLVGTLRRMPVFHSGALLGSLFLRFNCRRPPFRDVRVRQAFTLAVDKPAITEKITQAGEIPADSYVPPGTAGYQPPPSSVRHDPERGRRLLAEAGYPDGRGFPGVEFLYNEGEINEAIGIELQGMFARELNVRMTLRRQETKVYNRSVSDLNYDLARSNWVGDYDDPSTFLDMFVTDGGNNRTGWSYPAYDQLLAQAAQESAPDRRFELFRRAETILVSEQTPICPLYYQVGVQVYDPSRVGGVSANLLDEHPLKSMFIRPRGASGS